eukprot:366468-Chlamydomonas_euryale.AAC.6
MAAASEWFDAAKELNKMWPACRSDVAARARLRFCRFSCSLSPRCSSARSPFAELSAPSAPTLLLAMVPATTV